MRNSLVAAAGAGLIAAPAAAAVDLLTFEGIGNLRPVGDFYAPTYVFSPAALALVDSDAGGTGNFANEPSPDTVMFFPDADHAILNAPSGFTAGISFFYASSVPATVTVYDGSNATGRVLATLHLAAPASGCPGDPTGVNACWSKVGAAFAGTAFSVLFGGAANRTAFDNITIGSPFAVIPEPAAWALLIAGFGLVGCAARRRRALRAA